MKTLPVSSWHFLVPHYLSSVVERGFSRHDFENAGYMYIGDFIIVFNRQGPESTIEGVAL